MDLFDARKESLIKKNAPLADRMRPRTLDEYIGQEHILGPGRLLRRAIQIDQLASLIFYGPPGVGKTTLARIIANTTKAQFLSINAVLAGVKDIRDAIDQASQSLSLYGRRTILFIDEVHRFNKSQQDALLPHVENGIIILIGATTENPYFEVNKALVSRSRIFQLVKLTDVDLRNVALQALGDPERGYGTRNVHLDENAIEHLVKVANGDARGVLNALQLAVETTEPDTEGIIRITRTIAEESIQQRAVLYDKDGDAHYDTISAFIKSVRGSDPDAALYWMAKMVYAGEDPRFIFRRMYILASEDIGLADPQAISVVASAAQAFDYVGMPEGRFFLSQACLYLSTAPKSNSTLAFFDALTSVAHEDDDDVPNHLKDASRDGEGFGHGKGYLYPHAYRDHWVAQQYLPKALQGKTFYQPSEVGYEKVLRERVARTREAMVESLLEEGALGSDVWIKRAGSQVTLGDIRDRLLDLAELKNGQLFLDLDGRAGLIGMEAARRIQDGAIWICARSTDDFDICTNQVKQFPELDKPQILRCESNVTAEEIRTLIDIKVHFERIAGRNILFKHPNKISLIQDIAGLLAPEGVLVFAETVPSLGQRISDLVPQNSSVEYSILKKSEEALFNDPHNHLTNWNPIGFTEQLNRSNTLTATSFTFPYSATKRILPADVDHWLRLLGGTQKSLGDLIIDADGLETHARIATFLHKHLDNNDVLWKSSVAFFKIRHSVQE